MKWFKHISTSLDDPFIYELISKFGGDGYLVYFGSVEVIARECDENSPGICSISVKFLTKKLQVTRVKLVKILSFFQEKQKMFFQIQDDTVFLNCPKFVELIDDWTKKKLRSHSEVTPESLRFHSENPPRHIRYKIEDKKETLSSESVKKEDFAPALNDPIKPIEPDGKEPHGDFVRLAEKEYEALQVDYGIDRVKKAISDLNNYIGSTGRYYQSHYYRLRTWIEQEMRKKPIPPKQNQPKPVTPPEQKPDYEPYRLSLIEKHPKANKAFRERVIDPLREEIGQHSWKEFIDPLVVESFDKDSITLWVHPDNRVWVQDNYLTVLNEKVGKEINLASEIKTAGARMGQICNISSETGNVKGKGK